MIEMDRWPSYDSHMRLRYPRGRPIERVYPLSSDAWKACFESPLDSSLSSFLKNSSHPPEERRTRRRLCDPVSSSPPPLVASCELRSLANTSSVIQCNAMPILPPTNASLHHLTGSFKHPPPPSLVTLSRYPTSTTVHGPVRYKSFQSLARNGRRPSERWLKSGWAVHVHDHRIIGNERAKGEATTLVFHLNREIGIGDSASCLLGF
ncbi:hypothetical protein SCHPADRAFT_725528 [Schizopora paradoxa]|uniref:Uncharacterized protein n=1 Tax=Schizopora paradoxa TaxID=27342 RepID=A0A0H2R116_9AGAM|nr:hypothetical protein SCHPADRAFT_725528 [Schizopora paradoxa]